MCTLWLCGTEKQLWKNIFTITVQRALWIGVITQGRVLCSWAAWGQTPVLPLLGNVTLLVFYGCIINYQTWLFKTIRAPYLRFCRSRMQPWYTWVLCSGSQKVVISSEAQAPPSNSPFVCWQDSIPCNCKTGDPSPRGHLPFPAIWPSPHTALCFFKAKRGAFLVL